MKSNLFQPSDQYPEKPRERILTTASTKKKQSEQAVYEKKCSLLTGNKTTNEYNASVDKHQHQHYMVICKETIYRLHLYVSLSRLYQLLLVVIDVIKFLDGFHLLIPVFIDKSNSFVV